MSKTRCIDWIAAAGLLGTCGCSALRPAQLELAILEGPAPREIIAEQWYEPTPDPPTPPALVDEEQQQIAELLESGPRHSMVLKEAPFLEVIQSLLVGAPFSLTIERDIEIDRPVTVTLQNATLGESIDMVIRGSAGYSWRIDDDQILVTRFEERIFHLDYLNLPSETKIEVGGDMLASGVEQSGVKGAFRIKTEKGGEEGNIWNSVERTLEGLKSKDGTLQINRATGIIYMEDTPKRIDAMVQVLERIAQMLHTQVFIEAKILEVRLNRSEKYGIDWSALDLEVGGTGDLAATGSGVSFNGGSSIVFSDQVRFNAVLDFLETRGDVSVLSNPHIAVVNGQPAVMTVGFQFPYGDITGVDRDPETGFVTYGTSIKRAVLGLQLGLTPHVSPGGVVTLQIVPTITRIQRHEDVEIPTSITTTQTISNPVIDLQELATTVRVRAGESIVLAGLISQTRRTDRSGLAFFANLPILRTLFGHREHQEESRELVILLRPTIRRI